MAIAGPLPAARTIPIIYLDRLSIKSRAHAHTFRMLIQRLLAHLKELDRQAAEISAQIEAWHRNDELSRKLAAVPGIGPITASALVATVGNARNFASGRQLAAWLGLVPRQHSSGGKSILLGISKSV